MIYINSNFNQDGSPSSLTIKILYTVDFGVTVYYRIDQMDLRFSFLSDNDEPYYLDVLDWFPRIYSDVNTINKILNNHRIKTSSDMEEAMKEIFFALNTNSND